MPRTSGYTSPSPRSGRWTGICGGEALGQRQVTMVTDTRTMVTGTVTMVTDYTKTAQSQILSKKTVVLFIFF